MQTLEQCYFDHPCRVFHVWVCPPLRLIPLPFFLRTYIAQCVFYAKIAYVFILCCHSSRFEQPLLRQISRATQTKPKGGTINNKARLIFLVRKDRAYLPTNRKKFRTNYNNNRATMRVSTSTKQLIFVSYLQKKIHKYIKYMTYIVALHNNLFRVRVSQFSIQISVKLNSEFFLAAFYITSLLLLLQMEKYSRNAALDRCHRVHNSFPPFFRL